MNNLDKAIKDFKKKLIERSDPNRSNPDFPESKSDIWDDKENEEARRLQRIEEIDKQANDARLARCDAKMKEVGREKFMELIHSGEWSDLDELTPIEEEYWRLSREQHDINWIRKHDGKPYREEDDRNCQF